MGEEGACSRKCVGITFIVCCILLICLSAWYWYYLALGAASGDIAAIILYIISGLLLVLFGILGIVATIKSYETLLLYHNIVMITMLIVGILEIILAGVSLRNCTSASNPFQFICTLNNNNDTLQFWLPSATIMIGNILALIFGCMLRKMIKGEEEDANYY